MNTDQCPPGESVPSEGHPIPDLDGSDLPTFVVRDGATFLLCAITAQGRRSFPHTAGAQHAEVGPEGVLYSFSTVHVSSSQSVPYTIGYVDFPGDVRVLAKVRGSHHALGCDCAVRLASEGSEWFVEPVAGEGQ
ncbi:OB-fold domain-containing protein [Sphingomonas soli]|uniref:OB-fold domain-containing protein n=1 Tax=Sphingomonas soli TaxID=266127 RepID=UPI0009FE185D|nr:OB-fold domain-containing protein [Sphingomonas soli]